MRTVKFIDNRIRMCSIAGSLPCNESVIAFG